MHVGEVSNAKIDSFSTDSWKIGGTKSLIAVLKGHKS